MKVFCLALLLLIVSISPISLFAGDKWYANGNLHRKTVADWKKANDANKLATSADMALASPKIKGLVTNSGNMDILKPYAVELKKCIEEAASGEGYDNTGVGQIAAACIILMGWQ